MQETVEKTYPGVVCFVSPTGWQLPPGTKRLADYAAPVADRLGPEIVRALIEALEFYEGPTWVPTAFETVEPSAANAYCTLTCGKEPSQMLLADKGATATAALELIPARLRALGVKSETA